MTDKRRSNPVALAIRRARSRLAKSCMGLAHLLDDGSAEIERLERERAELRDCLETTHEALCIAAKKAGFMRPPPLPPDE